MSVFERIRKIRKDLKLTQDEFAIQIKISRSNLASIEVGRINITDRVISDICTAFNINEEWLRTGNGDIFKQFDRDEAIVSWAAKVARDDFDNEFVKKFATMMATLTEKEWELIETKMRWLVESKKD